MNISFKSKLSGIFIFSIILLVFCNCVSIFFAYTFVSDFVRKILQNFGFVLLASNLESILISIFTLILLESGKITFSGFVISAMFKKSYRTPALFLIIPIGILFSYVSIFLAVEGSKLYVVQQSESQNQVETGLNREFEKTKKESESKINLFQSKIDAIDAAMRNREGKLLRLNYTDQELQDKKTYQSKIQNLESEIKTASVRFQTGIDQHKNSKQTEVEKSKVSISYISLVIEALIILSLLLIQFYQADIRKNRQEAATEPTYKRSIQGKIEAPKTRFKPVQTGTNQYNLESIIEILPIQDRELVEKYLPVAKDIFQHLEMNEQISNKMRDAIIGKFQDTEYELSRSRTLQIQKILKNGKEILIGNSLKIA